MIGLNRGSYKPGYTRFFFCCLIPFFFLRVNFEVLFFCKSGCLTPDGLDESRIIGIGYFFGLSAPGDF
ncbi:hypothetical protein RCL_jg6185.t1 [Rhizophagus clarus]|uniref:Uncharacterized protein n=1 Tax=Rhizophagus clarus TaxID=94130 RepID=A0A8H3L4R0_9GLOM|nr:hypothetical protein RCL_jg6185.t1 [Rhizophagus clarus]